MDRKLGSCTRSSNLATGLEVDMLCMNRVSTTLFGSKDGHAQRPIACHMLASLAVCSLTHSTTPPNPKSVHIGPQSE